MQNRIFNLLVIFIFYTFLILFMHFRIINNFDFS